jgi:hypothetical protein
MEASKRRSSEQRRMIDATSRKTVKKAARVDTVWS